MKAFQIIQYISVIIWSLPPLRQYKGNFFYYFLFVSLADPLVFVLHNKLPWVPFNIYIVISLFAALISIIAIDKKIRWNLILPVFAGALGLGLSIPNWYVAYIMVALHIFVLYFSIRYVTVFAGKYRYISLFHFLFLIYNTSLLLKLIGAMVDPIMGAVYFYSTTIFDILLGVLFCIFREEGKHFALRLRESELTANHLEEEFITREYDSKVYEEKKQSF